MSDTETEKKILFAKTKGSNVSDDDAYFPRSICFYDTVIISISLGSVSKKLFKFSDLH